VSADPFLDRATVASLAASGRKTLVIAGFATEVVALHAALSAIGVGLHGPDRIGRLRRHVGADREGRARPDRESWRLRTLPDDSGGKCGAVEGLEPPTHGLQNLGSAQQNQAIPLASP
jgi:hypothetical protein